ncbi:MAG: 3'-5' exonuclease, partial [Flavisolibacter sp.]
HKAKGMEYDSVYLVNDFVTEQKIERTINESKDQKESFDEKKLNEEINLLYVAITRAKNKLHIPDSLLPKNFPSSPHIQVTKTKQTENQNKYQDYLKDYKGKNSRFYSKKSYTSSRKAYSLEKEIGTSHASYGPWTYELDRELIASYEKGKSIGELAGDFGRTKGAIIYRLKKLKYYPE